MTSSLVGSEMCIRDRLRDIRPLQCNGRHTHVPIEGGRAHPARLWTWEFAVSYTHLTLPTICSV
eukprot:5062982-Prorocentrum_lima.AAC.1